MIEEVVQKNPDVITNDLVNEDTQKDKSLYENALEVFRNELDVANSQSGSTSNPFNDKKTMKDLLQQQYYKKVSELIAIDKDTDILMNIKNEYTHKPKDFKQITDENYFDIKDENTMLELNKLYVESQKDKAKNFDYKNCDDGFKSRADSLQNDITSKQMDYEQLNCKNPDEKLSVQKKLKEFYGVTDINQNDCSNVEYNENHTTSSALEFLKELENRKNGQFMEQEFDQKLTFKPTYKRKEDRVTTGVNSQTKDKIIKEDTEHEMAEEIITSKKTDQKRIKKNPLIDFE